MRSAICIAAGRSAAPAAATLHSVLSTYVKIRPEMGTKTVLDSRLIFDSDFFTRPRHADLSLPKLVSGAEAGGSGAKSQFEKNHRRNRESESSDICSTPREGAPRHAGGG